MNAAVPPPTRAPAAARRRPRGWIWFLALAVAAVMLYFWLRPAQQEAGGAAPGGGGRGRGMLRPMTVAVAGTKTMDVHVYVTALGTVTPLNMVTVRSRADGQLEKLHFVEGQEVKEGDLLAEIDPRPYQVALQQAEGQLARDRALLHNAELDLQRYESAQEAVTQQQIDTAKAAVAQYEGAVKVDEGLVASDRLQLSYCRVTAPITGRIGLRTVDPGNLVRSTDTSGLAVITQMQAIGVIFSIPEDNLPDLNRAMARNAALPVEIFDRAMSRRLAEGTLAAVDNQIDSATGTVRLKATIPNEDRGLFPNQFVNVRLLVATVPGATVVPNSAIQISGVDRYVYVVDSENTVERRTVKLGPGEGETTSIVEGVKPGDTVVTAGLDRLQDGAKVTLPSATPASESGSGARAHSTHGGWSGGRKQS
ncbi:multidrug transporter subunit MdtA [Opitutaceae bacterium EW11]|nr:multidrug transporter subunit MdtA [Opitutaceae bacterium EW11]